MTAAVGGERLDGEEPRRFLIATAVSRYPKCPEWDRPGLVSAREQVIELFTGQLGYRHESALGLDPTVQQLREHLRAFCTSVERREDDLVVVYLSGHGEVLEDGSEHVLLMSDTDPADIPFTSLPTADLVRAIRGTRVRRLLLILDTCYSGQGGNELAAAALERLGSQWAQSPTAAGLVIVSSAQPHQQAKAGLFPGLLSQAVASRATAGHAPAHLSVSAVVQQMNSHPDKPAYQHVSLSLLGLTGEPPDFLTNPRHDVRLTDVDLAIQDAAEFDAYARRRDTEFTTRLLVRAMGYHGDGVQGWWFCGRHQVLAELADWINQGDALHMDRNIALAADGRDVVRVITAGPGSGKTAVLGLVAALTLPERRRTVPIDPLGLHEEMIPSEGSIDVVMYAQNLTNSEVLDGLAAAAGLKSTRVGELLDKLERQNGDRGRPFTVLIDALDEAATPDTLCSQIIRPLIEHSQGRIRLLLGTRPYLLDRLGISVRAQQKQVIDLDSPDYADQQALLAYTLRNLIQSRRTSPYRTLDGHRGHLLLRRVASAVADAAGTSFLVARFAAYTLASAEAVADPHDPAWRAGLPRHAGQAMRDDLTNRLGPDAQRATDLLRPLAYAEGQGLPWEDIWAPLASAISGRTYTDDDLLWLRNNAGSYVVEATENGRSAYRLYHQALTEHLREDIDASTVHRAFVDNLTACVPYRGDVTRDWSRAHPYTLHHLATHATAGRIDDILEDPEYLVHARPDTLTHQLRHATSVTARLTAAIYRTALRLHATAPASVRRIALALNAARAGATTLQKQLNCQVQPGTWIPTSATGSDFTTALCDTFTVGSGTVDTVACTTLDGTPIAISTASDGTVRLWDLITRQQLGEPLTRKAQGVNSVACTTLDGTPIAITGASDGTLRLWNLTTRQQLGEPLTGHYGPVCTVAFTVLDDTPIAVTGGNDGTVRLWDLATGQQLGEPLTGHTGPVCAVACTVLDSTPIALTGGNDGTVRLWDLVSRQQLGEPLTGHTGPVRAVACTVLDSTPIALTGSDDGTAVAWDLVTHRMRGEPLAGHAGPVCAVACTVLDGTPIAVTGSDDGTVRLWDLFTLLAQGEPLAGHAGPVCAVACTVLDGTPIAVTGGNDGTVQVWDLAGAALPSRTDHGLPQAGTVMACAVLDGTPIAITGGEDGTVQVWDLDTRRQLATFHAWGADAHQLFDEYRSTYPIRASAVVRTVLYGAPIAIASSSGETLHAWDLVTLAPLGLRPFTKYPRGVFPVNSLACTTLAGAPIAITGASDGTVRLWDLITRQQRGEHLTGHYGPVCTVAFTVLDDTPIAVTGGSDGTVRLWDLATGKQLGEPLTGHTRPVGAVACMVLDDAPIAITGSGDGTVRLWDLVTRQQLGKPLTGHTGWVSCVASMVLDGRPIAITGDDHGTVAIWDLRAGQLVQSIAAPACVDVAFASDGRIVVVLGRDIAVFERR
ncbi:caspase family protein [Streptomyces sp. NPDC058122]|uniref:caspase family protein n=1 Tax=Streptomyces sp. NPDC058122 TaxID=3346349 RepID=UPI0036EA104F